MNLFEKITKSPETLAEYISVEKGTNHGCEDCNYKEECKGKESCKGFWINVLNNTVE